MTEKNHWTISLSKHLYLMSLVLQCEKIYSRLMSSFFCCLLISCQCDSGHMKVVIHFDLRPVLVSMPYVPSWNCGRPPGSVPARTGPTVASCGSGCANQSESFPWVRAQPSPAQSQAAVLWVVGTYKETVLIQTSASSMLFQNSHDLVK